MGKLSARAAVAKLDTYARNNINNIREWLGYTERHLVALDRITNAHSGRLDILAERVDRLERQHPDLDGADSIADRIIEFAERNGYPLTDYQRRYLRAFYAAPRALPAPDAGRARMDH